MKNENKTASKMCCMCREKKRTYAYTFNHQPICHSCIKRIYPDSYKIERSGRYLNTGFSL